MRIGLGIGLNGFGAGRQQALLTPLRLSYQAQPNGVKNSAAPPALGQAQAQSTTPISGCETAQK